jgi:phosphopantothenoylcysteine decarboxylase/phosphopantothenate--cysteine ligase
MLKGKTVVLGVTGSIAAFKAVELASQLTQKGAAVDVVLTECAQEFITPLTFRSLTGRNVVTTMWDQEIEVKANHVGLAEAADIVVVAPATANIIAKMAHGIADDMITCTVLATKAPVLVSPAMNVNMYENPVTQENIARLKARGFSFVGPDKGRLASGAHGMGRFIGIEEIIKAIDAILGKKKDLLNKNIVVTAGGTQEPIDPVRCITNYSSGKMGYAIAEAATQRGASVTLITAPTSIDRPPCSCILDVLTAEEMFRAVKDASTKADVLIMAAAVADYRPKQKAEHKIKRRNAASLNIELEHTPDILAQCRGRFLRVGFAAESRDLMENARKKLENKKLDIIVANDITIEGSTFGSDNNQVIIIDRKGNTQELPLISKTEVAHKILDKITKLLGNK